MSSSTYRTLSSGAFIDADGQVLSDDKQPFPIHIADVTVTGTELQSGNTAPVTVVAGVTGKTIVPIAWHAVFDDAGTDFTGNTSLELVNDDHVTVRGEATNAISGGLDKTTVGTIISAVCAGALKVMVKTGDPTGGAAASSCTVRVFYVLI